MIPPTPPWEVDTILNCPCGSGLPYRKCCSAVLRSLDGQVRLKAETPSLRRAELARYIGWVFRHTQPLLEAGVSAEKLKLANVDLHAIVQLAEGVAHDMRTAPPSEVVSFFSRLQQYLYYLPGLADAILCLKASWLYFVVGDERGGDGLMEPLRTRDLSTVEYAPLLEVYVDRFQGAPVTQQLRVVERILELHARDVFPPPANLLHYAALRAMLSLMLGDHAAFDEILLTAAKQHLDAVERKMDIYSLRVAAMTHELLWRSTGDPDELGKAIEFNRKALDTPGLTLEGSQDFHQILGMLLEESGATADAVQHLEQASDSAGALVNLARAYVHAGRMNDAVATMKRIDRRELSAPMKLECLSVDALIAMAAPDVEEVDAVVARARGLPLADLYFQRTRDQLCITLLEFRHKNEGADRAGTERKLRGILAWTRYLAQFLELKPNFMGLGLNINQIIEGDSSKTKR